MHNFAAWGGVQVINVIQLCAGYDGRLSAMSGQVSVRFIALPMEFDGTQGPVYGGKSGSIELKYRLKAAAWGLPGAIKCGRALGWLQRWTCCDVG